MSYFLSRMANYMTPEMSAAGYRAWPKGKPMEKIECGGCAPPIYATPVDTIESLRAERDAARAEAVRWQDLLAAARLAGVKAGIEASAEIARTQPHKFDAGVEDESVYDGACEEIESAIRALDAEAIAKEIK